MISFYPGPSRVEEDIPRYVQEAYNQGILSINHRSDAFMELVKATISEVKNKLNIPTSYTVVFTSSATECWEIIAQSLITNTSHHIFNGAFGQKWFAHTRRITSRATSHSFDMNDELNMSAIQVPAATDVICLTQNETSNGTQISNSKIRELRKKFPDQLLAIDATSSMAGMSLDFQQADVWYASVQKCFGLPAGLAVMICSPQAVLRVNEINDDSRYNSLPAILNMMDKHQTTHTPNVLGIYLLHRVMQSRDTMDVVNDRIVKRYKRLQELLSEIGLRLLITNDAVRSHTVLPVQSDVETVRKMKAEAREAGLILGNGYGEHKASTFRIANFPAIQDNEMEQLASFLKRYK